MVYTTTYIIVLQNLAFRSHFIGTLQMNRGMRLNDNINFIWQIACIIQMEDKFKIT